MQRLALRKRPQWLLLHAAASPDVLRGSPLVGS